MKQTTFGLAVGAIWLMLASPTIWAQDVPQPPQPDQPPLAQGPGTAPTSQQADDVNENGDNPKRGVARISVVQGDVNVKRGDAGQFVAAAINAPLFAQDRLQTSDGSRAELQLDYANVVRLAPNTDLGVADLQYHKYQLQLGAGTVIYRVIRDFNSQAELDTPNISARPTQLGEYRISVLEDGTTEITVRAGELEVFSAQGSQRLRGGSTMLVRGAQNSAEFQTVAARGLDQFDDWSRNRDRQLLSSRSYSYVNPDVYGADDLDTYGNWVPSEYGNVWAPRDVNPGWAPYSNGHWVWTPYYGWSWVDYAPWGWAPFHYGNWFWNTGYNGWCWFPGARFGSLFWHPALVGFFGFGRGGGFGVGFGFGGGFGSFGWVPLAPFERFHPWYGRGYGGFGGGFGRGGIVNNVSITNIYRNARFNGAVRTASVGNFSGVNQRFGTLGPGQLRGASLVHGALPITPNRSSYQYTNRLASPNARLASTSNRQYFQANRTSAGRPFSGNAANTGSTSGFRSFGSANPGTGANRSPGAQGSQFGASHGVPPNMRTTSGFQNPGSGASARSSSGPSQRSVGQGGWHAFGDPGATSAARAGTGNSFQRGAGPSSSYGSQTGWHRFGDPEQARGNGSYSSGNYNGRPLSPAQGTQRSAQGYNNGYNGNGYSGSSYRNGYSGGSYSGSPRSGSYGSNPSYSRGGYSGGTYSPRSYGGSAPSQSSRQPASGSSHGYSGGSTGSHGGGGGSSFHGGGGGGSSHGSGGGGGHHGR